MILATAGIKTIVMFLYEDIRWGAEAEIGFNAGDGFSFFSLQVAPSDQTVDVVGLPSSGKMGVFVFRVDSMLISTISLYWKYAFLIVSLQILV